MQVVISCDHQGAGVAASIRFWFRGAVLGLDDIPATTSVLEWLRGSGASRGTKEGCNSGDCGACTVVLGELVDGRVRLTTAHACLLLMPMLDGRALFTVEDVGSQDAMHPVQRALIEHGGSQCGFCTPGVVMSLWRAAEAARSDGLVLTRADAADALTGNLCRCTGYRSIVDAAEQALSMGTVDPAIDWCRLAADLQVLARSDPGGPQHADFVRPTSEEELARALADEPRARVIAGGTDLVVELRATGEILDDSACFVSVTGVPSLTRIEHGADALVIGAAVPLEEAWAALVDRLPGLERMWRRFASPGVRSVGTIGGNIANASPIADLVPVLVALDADVVLRSDRGSRAVSASEIATGVRSTVLAPGEFLARIRIPASSFTRDVRAYKVSRRFDDDISSVSGVFALRLDADRIAESRVVFGGMARTVRRSPAVERALLGREWSRRTLLAAQEAVARDFSPIDDHRASGWYRAKVAEGLLERWWCETATDAPAVPVDVWAGR